MKRIRIMGLCLVAVFAFTAVAAASASAAGPEYMTCQKVSKVTVKYKVTKIVKGVPVESEKEKAITEGKFASKNCSGTELAPEPGVYYPGPEGKYELGSYSLAKTTAYKVAGGPSELYNWAPTGPPISTGKTEGVVSCTSSKGVGDQLNATQGVVTVEYKGCSTEKGALPCASGSKKGVITTDLMATQLVALYPEGQDGVLVASAKGGEEPLATFKCGPVTIETKGAALGLIAGDIGTISKEATDTFAVTTPEEGVQDFTAIYTEVGPMEGITLHSNISGYPGKEETFPIYSGQEGVAKNKGEALEIVG
jgi:hypothetical protein